MKASLVLPGCDLVVSVEGVGREQSLQVLHEDAQKSVMTEADASMKLYLFATKCPRQDILNYQIVWKTTSKPQTLDILQL